MIHSYPYNTQGDSIVIDVESGAVHVVDGLAADVLALYENANAEQIVQKLQSKYSEKEIFSALEEIGEREKSGTLFSRECPPYQTAGQTLKALCINIAHDCNLSCKYCFAKEGKYEGEKSLMPFSVGKAAIDFLIENSKGRKSLEIDFFGGEPLLNFGVVKEIIQYAKSVEKENNKNFRFTITTNATRLDESSIRYINENMQNVVLSIDGRKSVNDKMRLYKNGDSSYDAVMKNIQKLVQARGGKNYYIRGTYTKENLDFYNDIMHMVNAGFREVSVEPVVAGQEVSYSIAEEDLPVIFQEYEKIAQELLENDFHFFHFMIDLDGGPCAIKRMEGCGFGTSYMAVSPDGSLYPCHQFVGLDDFVLGNVFTRLTNTKKIDEIGKINLYTKEDCKSCWAKFYCGGGCAANAYFANGDIHSTYYIGCQLQRKRIECAIYVKVMQRLRDKEPV